MLASIALALLLDVSARRLALEMDVSQVMEMRSVIGLLMLLPFVYAEGGIGSMRTGTLLRHVGRNAILYVGQFAFVIALTLIPLADAVAIEFTAPIWAVLMAAIFLAESLTWRKCTAIVVGLAGVILIIHPTPASVNLGHILALAAAFLFAVSFIMTKSLTRRDSATKIIFWMLIIQSIIGFAPSAMVWTSPPLDLWPWIFVIAFSGTFAHYCVAQALRHAEAMVVMPIDYLRVPMAAMLGYLLYGEANNAQMMAGAVLIIVGNLFNLKRGFAKSTQKVSVPYNT